MLPEPSADQRRPTDNRIPAAESDLSTYTFITPEVGEMVTLSAELRFRRMFQEEMLTRKWDTLDVIMEEVTRTKIVAEWWEYYLPFAVGK